MKILSLWQPWASCIALGLKRIETRSWSTPYRGELFIHAAKRLATGRELAMFDESIAWKRVKELLGVASVLDLPRGAVVCQCVLAACVPVEEVTFNHDNREDRLEWFLGGYEQGRFAWKLERVKAFQPIVIRGAQGLFEPTSKADRDKLLLAGR